MLAFFYWYLCSLLKSGLQSVGITMGTNCTPLLADLFLFSYETEFIQRLVHEKKITPCDIQLDI